MYKLTQLILLLHSDPPQGDILVSNKIRSSINTVCCSNWRQTTAVVNRLRPSQSIANSRHPLCCDDILVLTDFFALNGDSRFDTAHKSTVLM